MNEIEVLREQLEIERKTVQTVDALLANESWKWLAAVIKGQLMTRRQADFARGINSLDDAFASATMRAEANALATVLALPQTLKDEAEINLSSIHARIEESENERADSADTRSN